MPPKPQSHLFVPAINPRALKKAFSSDVAEKTRIIVDLEDAVNDIENSDHARELKEVARETLMNFLREGGKGIAPFALRINSPKTEHYAQDITFLSSLAKELKITPSIVLPKAESIEEIQEIRNGYPELSDVLALIETREGLKHLPEMLQDRVVTSAAFGHHDFFYEEGQYPIPASALTSERYRSVLAEFKAILDSSGRDIPFIDGIYPHLKDNEGLQNDMRYVHNFFPERAVGKLTLNPGQALGVDATSDFHREVHLSNEDEEMSEADRERLARYTIDSYQQRSDNLAVTKAENNRYISPQEYQLAKKFLTDKEYDREFKPGKRL